MRTRLIISTLVLALSGCFPKEDAIGPVASENVKLESKADSSGLIFYSLKERKAVSVSSIYTWDLAFECRPNGFNIVINSARGMRVYNTKIADFRVSMSPNDIPWDKEQPCSDLNMMCFGDWADLNSTSPLSYRFIYILDLGLDANGYHMGYKRFYIAGVIDDEYLVRYSDLDGNNEHLKLITKDEDLNFIYFSFQNGGTIVPVEPSKETWDLLLTQYIEKPKRSAGPGDIGLNDNASLTYGVMTNPYKSEVTIDSVRSWEEITYFSTKDYKYSRLTNAIGNAWYSWNPDSAVHETKSFIYCLRDKSTYTYLLSFDAFNYGEGKASFSFHFKNL